MQQRIAWIDKQLFVNTSIKSVSLDSDAEGMIFMLDGRKMDLGKKLPFGLYIINGKKHYVR